MTKLSEYLKESSLSKVFRHNEQHDCGALTAFRIAELCGDGDILTKQQNMKRNKSLGAKLKVNGYTVIRVIGKYLKDDEIKKEVLFVVVDIKDKGNLKKTLIKLGEEFEQDSILFMPKGAIIGDTQAFLMGTNHCNNNWLGYGNKKIYTKSKFGKDGKVYTTLINGRQFVLEDKGIELTNPNTGYGYWSLYNVAECKWNDIEYTEGTLFEV